MKLQVTYTPHVAAAAAEATAAAAAAAAFAKRPHTKGLCKIMQKIAREAKSTHIKFKCFL